MFLHNPWLFCTICPFWLKNLGSCFKRQKHGLVYYNFNSVWDDEWTPFGKALLTRLAVGSHCILSICKFCYCQFWFWEWDLVFDCASSCSLPSCFFDQNRPHYANMSVQYTAIFHGCKKGNFQTKKMWSFSHFCSKHRSWVHVRTASLRRFLTSTHDVCFRAKIRKKCIPR